jgi:hypothetical protein
MALQLLGRLAMQGTLEAQDDHPPLPTGLEYPLTTVSSA